MIENSNSANFAPTTEFASSSLSNSQTEGITNKDQTDDKLEPDWSRSFFGLSAQAFSKEVTDILLAPIAIEDIECKPGKSSNLF
jgi:hypothetical protein